MHNILKIGKTGLQSMQNKIDNLADNISNANTTGYKKSKIVFSELLNNQISDKEVELSDELIGNSGISGGVKSSIKSIDFKQGAIQTSNSKLHLAIEGKGFFAIRDTNGQLYLTRNGGFHSNGDNSITDDFGNQLEIEYNISIDQWNNRDISISKNGEIVSTENDGSTEVLGKVVLYYPQNENSLQYIGEGKLLYDDNNLLNSNDNPELFGIIHDNSLEMSNVDITNEIIEMIMTQRSYELNNKTIHSTDEMLTIINNLQG